jgi:ribonuclease HI
MYEKIKAIKSQVLPDFTAEWLELQNTGPPDLSSVWTMYFDVSKRVQGTGAGVVFISPQGDKLKYVLRMSFSQASNNEAEYEAPLHGMKMAKACGATRLKIFGDSNLIVQQVMNRCDADNHNMTAYRNLYYYLEGTFNGCEVSHISRASNEEANNLANIGSQCLPIPPGIFWEEMVERSIKGSKTSGPGEPSQHVIAGSGASKIGAESTTEPEEVMMIEEIWMQPYLVYMMNKILPEDTVEAQRIVRRSKAFVVLQGKLYKKSITGVLQQCVTPQEGQVILKDIHAGVCGHHASSRAIAAKAFQAGFYWLIAIEDAKDIIRRCEACQQFASPTTRTGSRTPANTIAVAFRTMGIGHGREVAQVMARGTRLYVSSSRQIHQVGRGSPNNNSRLHSSNQLHQVNSISLWSAS